MNEHLAVDLHRTAIGLVVAYAALADGTAAPVEAPALLTAAAGEEFSVAELLCGVSAVAAGLAQMVADAAAGATGMETSIEDVLRFVGGRAAAMP